jgi:O-antigen/teichoic acid export membrane protein
MGFVFLPFYIHYLGIDGYGLIGVFAVMQVLFGLLDMGMAVALNRELARFSAGVNTAQFVRDLLRSMETVALGVALSVAVVVGLGADWVVGRWLNIGDLPVEVATESISIIGLVIGLRVIEGLYRSVLVGLQRHVLYNLISSVMATLRGAGALGVLAFVDASLETYFYWQLASSLVTLLVLAVVAYRLMPDAERCARFSKDVLWEVLGFAGGFLGFTLLNVVLTQADKLLLISLLDLGDYGYYMLAATVAGALNILTGPVVQAYFPRLSELHAKDETRAFAATYHQGAQIITVLFGTAAALLIMMSEVVLRLWTQDPELSARVAPLLTILALGNLLNGLMWMPIQIQLAAGWTSLIMRTNSVAVLLLVPAIFWAVPRFGPIGAAWVWVGLNAGYVLILIQFMHLRLLKGEKLRWYLFDVGLPLVASLAVTFVLSRVLNFETVGVLQGLVQLSFMALVAFAAAAYGADQVRVRLLALLNAHGLLGRGSDEV